MASVVDNVPQNTIRNLIKTTHQARNIFFQFETPFWPPGAPLTKPNLSEPTDENVELDGERVEVGRDVEGVPRDVVLDGARAHLAEHAVQVEVEDGAVRVRLAIGTILDADICGTLGDSIYVQGW